nr:MAG TPA: hypothetical protein [Caudoviricetes sp.]
MSPHRRTLAPKHRDCRTPTLAHAPTPPYCPTAKPA